MKDLLFGLAIFSSLAGGAFGFSGCAADDVVDCIQICEAYDDCPGDQDVTQCVDRCEDKNEEVIEACEECLDETENSCTPECLAQCGPAVS